MITILKQPNKYTPASNPVIFQMNSNDPAIQFFQVQVLADDNSVIVSLRLFTTPDNRTGSYTDLSGILSNVVDYQLLVTPNMVDNPSKLIQAYKLKITEKLYTEHGIIDGVTITTNLFYVWNAELNPVLFNAYNFNNYVITGTTGTTAQFLTSKPNYTKVNGATSEYLYLLNDNLNDAVISYKLYGNHTQLIGSYAISGVTLSRISRIDVSPKAISDKFVVDLTPVKFYTVQVKDLNGLNKTNLKTYTYEIPKCNRLPVEVLFANKLGGFDSFSFYAPRESVDVQKTTITRNPYVFDDAGNYTNVINGVMNPTTDTINSTSTSKYKVISAPLTDLETVWLKELIQSPKVYVRLSNSLMYPVQITNTNYPVLQKKFSTSLMRLEIEMSAPSGIELTSVSDLNANYNPPSIPYITIEGYCYEDECLPTFGYVEPDSDGEAIIEDGLS
ncbi:MAG: hypothetical protein V4520_02410 [Bacteroidota bacterium]